MSDDLASKLSDVLTDLTGHPHQATVTGEASVGATRRTYFADVNGPEGHFPVVIQLAGLDLGGITQSVEFDVVRLAGSVGVPVAEPITASDGNEGLGSPFQVSRRIDGLTVPRQILRACEADSALGPTLTRQLGDALGNLHGIQEPSIPSGVPRQLDPDPWRAAVHQLRGIAAAVPPSPVISLGFEWLARNLPIGTIQPSLVHSDCRNGNMIVQAKPDTGDYGLAALIDWELCHVGDPMEDLAWACLRCWRFGEDVLEVGGFGEFEALVAAYESAGGKFIVDRFHWWSVARTLWWCLVLSMQARAFTSGLSNSLVLAASGRKVAELEYDLLVLIDPLRDQPVTYGQGG